MCINSPLHSTKLHGAPLCVQPNIIYQHIYYHGNMLSKNNNVVGGYLCTYKEIQMPIIILAG